MTIIWTFNWFTCFRLDTCLSKIEEPDDYERILRIKPKDSQIMNLKYQTGYG